MANTDTNYKEMIEAQRREIERLNQELQAEVQKRREQAAKQQNINTLPVSRDLHRGVDPDRPERPDTLELRPIAKHETEATQAAMEAAVAGMLTAREQAARE